MAGIILPWADTDLRAGLGEIVRRRRRVDGERERVVAMTRRVPFVRMVDLLDADALGGIQRFARDHADDLAPSKVRRHGTGVSEYDETQRRSSVNLAPSELRPLLEPRLRALLPRLCVELGVAPFELGGIDMQVTRSGDGDFFGRHRDESFPGTDRSRVLTFVYYFGLGPQTFDGGTLRLDLPAETDGRRRTRQPDTIDIEPTPNTMVCFPADRMHEVRPVGTTGTDGTDGTDDGAFRWTINGWFLLGDVGRPRPTPADMARAAALERIATVRTEARIPGLIDVLAAAGSPAIALKGPVTRQRLYALDEHRPVSDVDLLVAPSRFRAAGRALIADGYERVGRSGHRDTFSGPNGNIELHLALPFTTVPPGRAFRVLSSHTTCLTVAGHRIPVLDGPTHVVHLALQAAHHEFDPQHRSFEEWRRGRASLSDADAARAEATANGLGVQRTWHLANLALEHPTSGADLAARLHPQELQASWSSVLPFILSPIPARIRFRAAWESSIRHLLGRAKEPSAT